MIISSSSHPLYLLSFSSPAMVKTCGGQNFKPRVCRSAPPPPPVGPTLALPSTLLRLPPPLPSPPLLCPLLLPPPPLPLPRAVLPWVLQRLLLLPMPLLLLLLPHAGTIPRLALFLPLPHILGYPGRPHLPKGPEPLA